MGWLDGGINWREALQGIMCHPVTLIAAGSAVGGNLRHWLARWVDTLQGPLGLPWGTFVVNIGGSVVLGFLGTLCLERAALPRRELFLLLGTGLCGGFTTFSTFEWETYKLVREGSWPLALAKVGGSCLAGFLGVFAGAILAHLLTARR